MPSAFRFPSHLYAILDTESAAAIGWTSVDVLDAWLDAGVRLVQLRTKSVGSGELLRLADEMALHCRAAGAMFIVNDRADIAAMAGADGVHVGQEDLPPAAVRAVIGPGRLVGLSTHSDSQLLDGCREPVDYLAIGPVFATATKVTDHPAVGVHGVRQAARAAHKAGLRIVAIGGITVTSAPDILAAGADAVAVISDLFIGAPGDRVREYLSLA